MSNKNDEQKRRHVSFRRKISHNIIYLHPILKKISDIEYVQLTPNYIIRRLIAYAYEPFGFE